MPSHPVSKDEKKKRRLSQIRNPLDSSSSSGSIVPKVPKVVLDPFAVPLHLDQMFGEASSVEVEMKDENFIQDLLKKTAETHSSGRNSGASAPASPSHGMINVRPSSSAPPSPSGGQVFVNPPLAEPGQAAPPEVPARNPDPSQQEPVSSPAVVPAANSTPGQDVTASTSSAGHVGPAPAASEGNLVANPASEQSATAQAVAATPGKQANVQSPPATPAIVPPPANNTSTPAPGHPSVATPAYNISNISTPSTSSSTGGSSGGGGDHSVLLQETDDGMNSDDELDEAHKRSKRLLELESMSMERDSDDEETSKKKKKLKMVADALRRADEKAEDQLKCSYLIWPDDASYEKWCSENGQAGLPRKIMMRNIFAKDSTYRPDNNRNNYPKGQLRHCWETYKHRDEFEDKWSEQETGARRAEIRTIGKALGKTYKGTLRAKAEKEAKLQAKREADRQERKNLKESVSAVGSALLQNGAEALGVSVEGVDGALVADKEAQLKPHERNAPTKPPSLTDWADEMEVAESGESPITLKIFAIGSGGLRSSVSKEDWTNHLSNQWEKAQKKATIAYYDAKRKKSVPLPVRPRFHYVKYDEDEQRIVVSPVDDSSRDWAVSLVKSHDFVVHLTGPSGGMRRFKAYHVSDLAATAILVCRFPVKFWKGDGGGREGDDWIYRKAFGELMSFNCFPEKAIKLERVQRLEDKFGRCDLVDVWCHITLEGIQYLKEEDCVVNGPVVDANPRLHIEGTLTKKPGFVELKKCSDELIQKLLKKRG